MRIFVRFHAVLKIFNLFSSKYVQIFPLCCAGVFGICRPEATIWTYFIVPFLVFSLCFFPRKKELGLNVSICIVKLGISAALTPFSVQIYTKIPCFTFQKKQKKNESFNLWRTQAIWIFMLAFFAADVWIFFFSHFPEENNKVHRRKKFES